MDVELDRLIPASVSVLAIATSVVHLAMGLGVGADAAHRLRKEKPLAFFGPVLWFFVTCIGGLLAVGLYWGVHYSTLTKSDDFPGR
jgi:hypothetical protein